MLSFKKKKTCNGIYHLSHLIKETEFVFNQSFFPFFHSLSYLNLEFFFQILGKFMSFFSFSQPYWCFSWCRIIISLRLNIFSVHKWHCTQIWWLFPLKKTTITKRNNKMQMVLYLLNYLKGWRQKLFVRLSRNFIICFCSII